MYNLSAFETSNFITIENMLLLYQIGTLKIKILGITLKLYVQRVNINVCVCVYKNKNSFNYINYTFLNLNSTNSI